MYALIKDRLLNANSWVTKLCVLYAFDHYIFGCINKLYVRFSYFIFFPLLLSCFMHLSIWVFIFIDIGETLYQIGCTKSYFNTSKYVICSKIDSLKTWIHCRFSASHRSATSRQVIIFQLHCYSLLSGKEEASIMNDTNENADIRADAQQKKNLTNPIVSLCLLKFHSIWVLFELPFVFR